MSMTWKEFKEAVEAAGVSDNDKIWYIDVSYPDHIFVDIGDESGFTVETGVANEKLPSEDES